MRTVASRLLISTLLLFQSVSPLSADFPYPAPPADVDPNSYHKYMFLPPDAPLPNDFSSNYWKFTSDRSADPVRNSKQELYGVMGASIDRAWRFNTGRPDVVVGIRGRG